MVAVVSPAVAETQSNWPTTTTTTTTTTKSNNNNRTAQQHTLLTHLDRYGPIRTMPHHDVAVSLPGTEHLQLLELVHAVREQTGCKVNVGAGSGKAGDGKGHRR